MSDTNVKSFLIDSKLDADAYLNDLLKDDSNRSIEEVKIRAQKYIQDPIIKKYFIAKAEEMLQTLQ